MFGKLMLRILPPLYHLKSHRLLILSKAKLPLPVRPIHRLLFPCRMLTRLNYPSDSGVSLHTGNVSRWIIEVRRNVARRCGRNKSHLYALRQSHDIWSDIYDAMP
jgi:hypothetical protein